MNIYENPPQNEWSDIVSRPAFDFSVLKDKVNSILTEVKVDRDQAVKKYTRLFDGVELDNFKVGSSEFTEAETKLSEELKDAIKLAATNIEKFHLKQKASVEKIDTVPGVTCWRKSVGIERVGLYIPGGSAPLFSTILMLGIPAKIASCKEIILCSPPDKQGKLHPAILYTARLLNIDAVYKVGGVQAIGAMAYGTQSIPKVNKIFGPGNQYVTLAKQIIQQEGVSIDMPAGPSEVCVLADYTADAHYVAADLLSQAEHGPDSQVILITTSKELLDNVQKEISIQLADLPRKEIAAKALENSKLIFFTSLDTAISLANNYAAEHLIIACENAESIGETIINAGSVFLGNYSPESAGDYASGTNHTLPTNGYARAYSGVSLDSFVKKITFQQLSKEGLQHIGKEIILMAEAEGLSAHANAIRVRTNQ